MEKVKRNCTYNDKLLKKGDIVYINEPFNFGKRKIFDENRNLIAFCEVEWNDFEWGLPEPSPSQVLTAEEVLKKCLLKWCPEKERPDFEKDWKGRVDNDVFNSMKEAIKQSGIPRATFHRKFHKAMEIEGFKYKWYNTKRLIG